MTALIAIDWGTSRFRAYRVGADGRILEETASDEGMAATAKDAFEDVLLKNCGDWMEAHPEARVMMAGMVGSRNGWIEVPYAECPAGAENIARGAGAVTAGGRPVSIAPGLLCRNDGLPDVMRGEETLILGAGTETGTVVLPGTHSKWARVDDGRITAFRTYMTGEFYALLTKHSVLRLLATTPADREGFAKGLAAARQDGGLTAIAFAARTRVLAGDMDGSEVEPFLSGLLIGLELREALGGARAPITVVADGILEENYRAAFASFGLAPRFASPQDCFVAGLLRLAAVTR